MYSKMTKTELSESSRAQQVLVEKRDEVHIRFSAGHKKFNLEWFRSLETPLKFQ